MSRETVGDEVRLGNLTFDGAPWAKYTPSLGGTGWSLGNGSAVGYYSQVGSTITFWTAVTWGSTSTFGTSELTVSLPKAGNGRGFVNNRLRDVSANYYHFGMCIYRSPSFWGVNVPVSGARLGSVTSTVPFTWASGDSVVLSGYYEVA